MQGLSTLVSSMVSFGSNLKQGVKRPAGYLHKTYNIYIYICICIYIYIYIHAVFRSMCIYIDMCTYVYIYYIYIYTIYIHIHAVTLQPSTILPRKQAP